MRNLSFDAYFSFLIGKWSWLPRAPLTVKCLQTRPNNWHTGWNFWANHHIEIMFLKFSEVNPLNLLTCLIKSESHNRPTLLTVLHGKIAKYLSSSGRAIALHNRYTSTNIIPLLIQLPTGMLSLFRVFTRTVHPCKKWSGIYLI